MKLKGIKATTEKIKSTKSWLFYHLKKLRSQGLVEFSNKDQQLYLSLSSTGNMIQTILLHQKPVSSNQTKINVSKKRKNNDV